MSNALVYLLQPRRILLDFWQKDTAFFPPSRNTYFTLLVHSSLVLLLGSLREVDCRKSVPEEVNHGRR